MKSLKKPQFILGLVSHVVFLIAILLMANNYPSGQWLMYAGLILGAIYWIWSIIEVSGTDDLKRYQKTFWLILVISIPMFGALLYHILHQSRNKIVA
jgi:4-hydroxybenzoate polyprenyltransferase